MPDPARRTIGLGAPDLWSRSSRLRPHPLDPAGTRPCLVAITTASSWVCAPSFVSRLFTYPRQVLAEIPRSLAMASTSDPSASLLSTSHSRPESGGM